MPSWMRTLGVTVVVVALAYSISRIPRPSQRPETPAAPSDVTRIEIREPAGTSVVAEKIDGQWRLTQPLATAANEGMVTGVASALKSITLEAVLSRRKESHAMFGVEEGLAPLVTVGGPGTVKPLEWIVGKNTPDSTRVYLRVPGRDDVYLAKGITRETVSAEVNQWRESRILPLAADAQIQSVHVKRGAKSFRLARSSAGWTVDGKPADAATADRMVNALRYQTAEEFVDPPAALETVRYGLDRPSAVITVSLSSGPDQILRFGKQEKGEIPRIALQREGTPTVYRIPARALELLTVTLPTLTAK